MRMIPAKTILSSYREDGWFGSNYNMNIYKGCCHGCIYCDSRSECYHIENFDEVRSKENALWIIESELKAKRKTGVILTGSMSDPYNPFEKEYEFTRGGLKLIEQYGFGVIIITKSDLVIRDLDLLQKIKRNSPTAVIITITTAEDELCQEIEPQVIPTSKRLAAIKALADAGIPCGILLTPLLPFINDTTENIKTLVNLGYKAGTKWIYNGFDESFGVTLRQNQRAYFFEQLDKLFPSLKEKYIQTYGNSYMCISPISKELWNLYEAECTKLGLSFRMPDIIKLIQQGYEYEQMSFF